LRLALLALFAATLAHAGGKLVETEADGGVKCKKPDSMSRVQVKLPAGARVRDLVWWADPLVCERWVTTEAVASKRLALAMEGEVSASDVRAVVKLQLELLGLEVKGSKEIVEKGGAVEAPRDGGTTAVASDACPLSLREDLASGTKVWNDGVDVEAALVDRFLADPGCLASALSLAKKGDGLVVTSVDAALLFGKLGLFAKDELRALIDQPLTKESCESLKPATALTLTVSRDGKALTLPIRLKNRKPGPASVRAFCSALLAAVRG
jgi:hypothetical protein